MEAQTERMMIQSNEETIPGTPPTLPVIDISPFVDAEKMKDVEARKQVAQQIHHACAEVGFFYITNHGVAPELVEGVLSMAREFFGQPVEEKEKISIYKHGVRGYQHLGENVTKQKKDWHEGIDYYKETTEEDNTRFNNKLGILLGTNPWPEQPSAFKETYQHYISEMNKLGAAVMRAMAMGLGLDENYFVDKYISDPFWVIRIIGYPPLATSEGNQEVGISCGEHTDYGCLTILNQDSTRGALQVQQKDGQWLNANPIPGAFVMNIGDMIELWTNGLYKATLHRVINTMKNYRVSVPFFYEPNFEATVAPLPSCCADDNPPKYKPIMYGDHLSAKVNSNFYFQKP